MGLAVGGDGKFPLVGLAGGIDELDADEAGIGGLVAEPEAGDGFEVEGFEAVDGGDVGTAFGEVPGEEHIAVFPSECAGGSLEFRAVGESPVFRCAAADEGDGGGDEGDGGLGDWRGDGDAVEPEIPDACFFAFAQEDVEGLGRAVPLAVLCAGPGLVLGDALDGIRLAAVGEEFFEGEIDLLPLVGGVGEDFELVALAGAINEAKGEIFRTGGFHPEGEFLDIGGFEFEAGLDIHAAFCEIAPEVDAGVALVGFGFIGGEAAGGTFEFPAVVEAPAGSGGVLGDEVDFFLRTSGGMDGDEEEE